MFATAYLYSTSQEYKREYSVKYMYIHIFLVGYLKPWWRGLYGRLLVWAGAVGFCYHGLLFVWTAVKFENMENKRTIVCRLNQNLLN